MDSLVTAAARALAFGDPLAALNLVALREDPPALALRGSALAQLGDWKRAKQLLVRAERGFGSREPVARARCAIARAEIALASRELDAGARELTAATRTLTLAGDRVNALHAQLLAARRLLLIGRLAEAERQLARADFAHGPDALAAIGELVRAEISLHRTGARAAALALGRARAAATRARVPALVAEVERAQAQLASPAARAIARGSERLLRLDEVEALLEARDLLIADACRRSVRAGETHVELARRPVLFALARALAEAWPEDVSREALLERAFEVTRPNDTHRARLRVEIGRLRKVLGALAEVHASARGFQLVPRRQREVIVLVPPIDGVDTALLALLADGEAWSTSALALALGGSQRSVQRALGALETSGRVHALGQGRSRRWRAPAVLGYATSLLLPASLTVG